MKRTSLMVVIATLAMAATAQAQTDTLGRDIAVKNCSECHLVGSKDETPKSFTAPSFADIANMTSTTLLSVKVFLQTPHSNMPNLILNEAELDAIANYIVSLKRN